MKTTKRTATGLQDAGDRAEVGCEVERRALERQHDQLMRLYAGQCVALSGRRVVDHDQDDEALAARMFKKFGDAPFYLARVEDSPAVYELPSPELAG